MHLDEINELKERLVEQLSPVKIYLFGSYANGANDEYSDFDFYIVVDDSHTDLLDLAVCAFRSVRNIKKRPVDISGILIVINGGRNPMATSESQKKARDKWLKEKVEDIRFRVPMGKKDLIREHAQGQGESVNAFINRAVDEAMVRDAEKAKQK